ncbi:hypothetical protein [Bacillus sp. NPDC077027]
MWIIIILLIVLIGFTGNMVSLLRNIKQSNEKIIKLLDDKHPPK